MEKKIIKFWAPGCVNCKALEPTMESLAAEYSDIRFENVKTADADELVAKYDVTSLPTLIFLKDGEMVGKVMGLKPKSLIIKKIAEVF